MSTRLAVVTGATGKIGAAIARSLSAIDGYDVLLLVRNEVAGTRLAEALSRAGKSTVRCARVDLSLHESIRSFALGFREPVHMLTNTTAIAPRRRAVTNEGIEVVFATNVLGYFWLTTELEGNLHGAGEARVVDVASYWAGDLSLDDLEFERRPYDNDKAYRQSKQANRMLSVALAERYRDRRITVNACHPGDVNSKLSNDLGFGGSTSADDAAKTPVWLATAPELAGVSGKYFADCREQRCAFGADREAILRLVEECERRTLPRA
jgi:NAD(P)-dependent dehydrogenase (short-subunit alcohol dehydrogenase family)